MAKTKINFIVGLVVLVALLVLLFGIHFLKNTSPGEKMDKYFAIFDRVSTLTVGDPVKLNGVTMGRVKNIELWNNKVRINFIIKRSFRDEEGVDHKITIPRDSRIRVQNIGLMGERQIEIHLGKSEEAYQPGDIIQDGLFDAGIAEAMGTAGKVFDEAEQLVLSVKQAVDSTIGQKDFVPLFRNIMSDTRVLTGKLNQMIDSLDPKIQKSVDNLERVSVELDAMLNAREGPLNLAIQNGLALSEDARGLIQKVEKITEEISVIMKKVNSSDGTLGAMIHDSLFYRELRKTIYNADSLLLIIRKQGLDLNVDIF